MRLPVALAPLLLPFVSACGSPDAPPPTPQDPASRVDPFIGSGGFGYGFSSCFPGAVAPQGLAKAGPDTWSVKYGDLPFQHFSGYFWGDDRIQGFSHLHLHGTGATDYGVLAAMPRASFSESAITTDAYRSGFDKSSERASPGYYAVTLDGGISVELTATVHAAAHRYRFGGAGGHVLFDLDHHLDGGSITHAEASLSAADRRVRGVLHSVGGMSGGFGGYDVYFEIRSRQPWAHAQIWSAGNAPAEGTSLDGTAAGFDLDFTGAADPVELQVGLSMVSADGATKNLDAEMPAFDFDGTRAATEAAWQALLDAVKVGGGSESEQRIFATAVYHAYLMPTIQSDVDGSYRGQDGAVHTATGFHYVSDMSLWDTYRTLHPLYALVAPDRALDAVRSLVAMATDAGRFSRWPIATGEAGTMIGASADVVIANAWLRGVTGFDARDAYARLRAAALDPTPPPAGRGPREPADGYMRLGYVPASEGRSVSVTTEFARDDFALGNLAAALGESADAAALHARSQGYRQLFDPTSGFLWSKDESGNWASPHTDAVAMGSDFAEANAWQSVWMDSQDDGFAALFGGNAQLVDKLEQFFELSKTQLDADADNKPQKSLPRPYYWQGNEPDIHAAYIFAAAGRPDLTQKWVRWIEDGLYGDGDDGIPGNDDGGTLSTWYVWSALGMLPVPGSDQLILGAPRFPIAAIAVGGGTFTVEAKGVSADDPYVQSVTLDGQPLAAPLLHQAQIHAGGVLHFEMGPQPGTWGR